MRRAIAWDDQTFWVVAYSLDYATNSHTQELARSCLSSCKPCLALCALFTLVLAGQRLSAPESQVRGGATPRRPLLVYARGLRARSQRVAGQYMLDQRREDAVVHRRELHQSPRANAPAVPPTWRRVRRVARSRKPRSISASVGCSPCTPRCADLRFGALREQANRGVVRGLVGGSTADLPAAVLECAGMSLEAS